MDFAVVLWSVAAVLVIAGLAGLFLPAIPGSPLIFIGLALAAWADRFAYAGFWTLAVLALLALLAFGVDIWAALFGAKKFGASKYAGAGAFLGAVVGLLLGFPGIFFGPFIGAVGGELLARKNLKQAARSGIGAALGLVLGAALKLALGLTMIGIFVLARFF